MSPRAGSGHRSKWYTKEPVGGNARSRIQRLVDNPALGSIIEVQHRAGHGDSRTTQRYLHYKARADEARRLAAAFTPAGT